MQLGKVIGGGLPVGAYGGRKDIMQMVAPAGEDSLPILQFSSVLRKWLQREHTMQAPSHAHLSCTRHGEHISRRRPQDRPALGEVLAGMMQRARMGLVHGSGLGSAKAECELAAPACRPHAEMGSMHGPG